MSLLACLDYLRGPRARRALLDPLTGLVLDDALHVDALRVDVVGVDLAGLHHLLRLHDGHLAGRRHHRVEVARRLAEDQVALGVGLEGMDEAEVGHETLLQHVGLAVEVIVGLPLAMIVPTPVLV